MSLSLGLIFDQAVFTQILSLSPRFSFSFRFYIFGEKEEEKKEKKDEDFQFICRALVG
jgi:hypothetical protein